jgi:hypothetical protein
MEKRIYRPEEKGMNFSWVLQDEAEGKINNIRYRLLEDLNHLLEVSGEDYDVKGEPELQLDELRSSVQANIEHIIEYIRGEV